ncbi:cobalt-precorrin-6A reductase [Roseospirillum parvum]|uniref:Precorrin-6A/cobalt-precorrin-6A reductase n=1 Tax=Roseospirillum parvum TaxID=83401 RepID=A0A1G8AVD1_9PROT|nr:cobalt-precorrin-6A reductase [Roseospirillum parvum]SDH24330.1 precorrin-6A/cobalt-precorrin-6A reductase [Roseospirillum parvum]
MSTILILGGTTDAYALAERLTPEPGRRVITSLAGRTPNPRRPAGELRVGGFGGPQGLAAYLKAEQVDAVVDATHPFAATMGWNAAQACATAAIPLVRLDRPAWMPQPGDLWHPVADWPQAVTTLHRLGSRRVLLAVGRQDLAPFANQPDIHFLIRAVSPPDPMPPFPKAHLILDRGPFSLEAEHTLLAEHQIEAIICKNSGGAASAPKLAAARERQLPVIIRNRPPRPPHTPTTPTPDTATAWLVSRGL